MIRRPMRTALPENQKWRDTGCEFNLGPCLSCPLPVCVEDEIEFRTVARAWKALQLAQEGETLRSAAALGQVSLRTVNRAKKLLASRQNC